MKPSPIIFMISLLGACATHQKPVVGVYYKEPSSCDLVSFMHEESSSSYEDALHKLKNAAEEKGANVIRLDTPPNVETFIGGSSASSKWIITYYAEGNVYHCSWPS